MNQQGSRQKALGRLQVFLLTQRLPERPKQLDKLAVMGRQFFNIPALAHLQAQGLGAQHILGSGFEDNGFFQNAKVEQRRINIGPVAARASQHDRRDGTKTLPLQLFAHLLALVLGQLRQHDQAP